MNKSWEIIIAGILLFFVAIFVVSKDENGDTEVHQEETELREAVILAEENQQAQSQSLQVIRLEELAQLQELESLENTSLKSLEKLKELSKLIPQETKQELLAEINAAISELEDDSFSIDINIDDQIVVLQKQYAETKGEWARVSSGVYATNKDFDASELREMSVKLTGGSLILVGTNDSKGSYSIKASGTITSRDSLSNMFNVDILNKGEKAEFRVNKTGTNSGDVQLQTILRIPSSMNIISYTAGGHIEATNFQGECEFKTSGGHIKLNKIEGEVTAFTEGGHVTIEAGKGDISLKSLGGHLQALNTEGTLEMRTSGGNVEAQNFSGSVNAFTSGGNIKLDIKNLTGEVQARNGAGQIDLLLPSVPGFNLNSNGTKIEIDSEFSFSGNKKKGQAIGNVGDGKINVTAKTGYGTVTIKKND